MSDRELLKSARVAVQNERETTAVVLRHFLLVEERRLFALKYPSLFAWATEELGYSEGAAQRRMDAARLLRELPLLAEKIEFGALSLTNLSQAKSFFRQEKKAGKNLLPAERAAVLCSLERKSSREGLKHPVSLSSSPQRLAARGTLRSLGNGKCAMRLIMNDELAEDLTRIKSLWAHALPDADWVEIIARMAKVTLDKIDPLMKAARVKLAKDKKAQAKAIGAGGGALAAGGERHFSQRDHASEEIDAETGEVQLCLPLQQAPALPQAQAQTQTQLLPTPASLPQPLATSLPPAVATKRSRQISAATTHEVWLRDQGQCAYVDADGKRCSSRYALERDHETAFAAGGGNDAGNIRLYCRSHNAFHADQTFGRKKVARMREKRPHLLVRQSK